MGLFSIFKKKISIGNIDSKNLVVLRSGKKLKFGTNLDVPDGFVAALVYRNKIADTFTAGRYRLDTNNMPLLTRMEKLSKPNKKGNLKKFFKADIYYINLKSFEGGSFESFEGIVVKDKVYKNVTCKLCGKFSYEVFSPVDFMEGMFMRYGILRDGVAKNEISCWVAELSTKFVQKQKLNVLQLYSKDSICIENLQDQLNKELYDVGLKIKSIEITQVKFPKKIYKKITLSPDELMQKPKNVYVGEQHDLENPVRDAQFKNFENQSNEVYLQEANAVEDDMTSKTLVVDSQGKSDVETGLPTNLNYSAYGKTQSQTDNGYVGEVFGDDDTTQTNTDNSQTEVQSDFEEMKYANQKIKPEVVQKTLEYKKCSNCGAYNSKSAETCFSCGHKFN